MTILTILHWSCILVLPRQPVMALCGVQVDIFSLGMVLSEMLSGQFPDRYHVVDLMISDKAVAGIVRDCCQADPCLRPSARQVYERLGGSSPEAHSALGNTASRQADLV